MAGGTFKAHNKIRAGAYINFKAIVKPLSSIGTRGVATMPLAMSWGDEVTELLSIDLLDGKSLSKIGYSAFDEESQILREALKNCYKVIVYRLDTGGLKATATIDPLVMTAKYQGIIGNEITVSIIEKDVDKFEVVTLFKSLKVDGQIVSTIEELVSNDYVVFSGTGALTSNTGVNLVDGTNGEITALAYANYLNTIKSYKWDVMGIPQDRTAENSQIVDFIEDMRENLGKKVQAVLFDAKTDYEGIISVSQGYKTVDETISPTVFVAYMTGLTAGSDVNTSNTYHVIIGATSIVYPIGTIPYGEQEIIDALQTGQLVLSTRQDGAVVIEQDINTLHNFTVNRPYSFSKNRVIRTLDEIANSVARLFENSYIGKVSNNDNGRNIFKADVISYLNKLQEITAIQNFNSGTDIQVYAGETIDAIVVDLAIQSVDSMEKLYLTVMVG